MIFTFFFVSVGVLVGYILGVISTAIHVQQVEDSRNRWRTEALLAKQDLRQLTDAVDEVFE